MLNLHYPLMLDGALGAAIDSDVFILARVPVYLFDTILFGET